MAWTSTTEVTKSALDCFGFQRSLRNGLLVCVSLLFWVSLEQDEEWLAERVQLVQTYLILRVIPANFVNSFKREGHPNVREPALSSIRIKPVLSHTSCQTVWRQRLTHREGPPHNKSVSKTEHTSLLKVG